jgi:flagellar assembly protein FliH
MKPWAPPSLNGGTAVAAQNGSQAHLTEAGFSAALKPDVAAPSIDQIQSILAKAYQDGFTRGLQEGISEGRIQGGAIGREEGFAKGYAEGMAQGQAEGFQASHEKISALHQTLLGLIASTQELTKDVELALTEWVYQTALRLGGREVMDRSVLTSVIQEALMRLPRPGESIVLRVPAVDYDVWKQTLGQDDAVFNLSVIEDPDTPVGHAYVELFGTRIDVGSQARQALVRSALGLMKPETTATK